VVEVNISHDQGHLGAFEKCNGKCRVSADNRKICIKGA